MLQSPKLTLGAACGSDRRTIYEQRELSLLQMGKAWSIAKTSSYDGVAGRLLDPDVASILGDLRQRDAMNDSAGFAVSLAANLAPVIAMRSQPRLSAHFAVLKAKEIPAILLETGYVTNREDIDVLFSKGGQKRIARAIAEAIEQTADGTDWASTDAD